MRGSNKPLTTVNYRKLVGKWCERCGWDSKYFGTHSIRRTLPSVIYGATKDLRSCQLILGHRSVSNTALYLGVQQEDAFEQVRKHRIWLNSYLTLFFDSFEPTFHPLNFSILFLDLSFEGGQYDLKHFNHMWYMWISGSEIRCICHPKNSSAQPAIAEISLSLLISAQSFQTWSQN